LDIFAGIGGMRRGLESAGHRCVGYIEWDKFSRQSYEAIFDTKGEWTAHDVTTVKSAELPAADIWTFGFPCQDLSVAGKQLGFSGNRSSLFFTVMGLIRELPEDSRPEWLIAENVMGFLSCNRGWDFIAAQVALDEIGYDCEWEVFNATQFGIPQNRQRVFLVGHSRRHGRREVFPIREDATEATETLRDVRSQNEVIGFETAFGNSNGSPVFTDVMRCLDGAQSKGVMVYHYHSKDCTFREFNDVTPTLTGYMGTGGNNVPLVEGQPRIIQRRRGFNKGGMHDIAPTVTSNSYQENNHVLVTRKGRGDDAEWIERDVATCLDANYFKGLDAHQARTGDASHDTMRIRKLTPLECWRLMGRTDADFYAAKSAGVSDTQLYKQAGNSLIPQIVQAIGQRIADMTECSVRFG